MYRSTNPILVSLIFSLLATCGFSQEAVDFNTEIRPLLSSKCFACHGPDENERAADLRLDTQSGAQMDLGGYFAIVPGKPSESELVRRLLTDDVDERMPPEGKGDPFNQNEIALIQRWIEQGAAYATHWSYTKPKRPEIPSVAHANFPIRNPVDSFVLRKMLAKGMEPNKRADRLTLARRVSLDLTGLPPNWGDAKKFADDPSPDAFIKFVDQLLQQPTYGERWAQVWLDLARYADSAGHSNDLPRTIWAYRDWVINAFNDNKPFDEFTIEQIGGDLLNDPTNDQLVATAFHRNTLTNNEGGTSNEEFRNAAVVDRVNTTMEVWMGTTMACAQCHTHKYDPITQKEYFQFFDFFNQTEDNDLQNEKPVLDLWLDPNRLAEKKQLQSKSSELDLLLKKDTPTVAKSRQHWITRMQEPTEWEPMVASKMSGGNFAQQKDWIDAGKTSADNATFRIEFDDLDSPLTTLRLETGPQQSNNFVLSQIQASWTPNASEQARRSGRFVRIELPGKNRILHVAEIEIYNGTENIAGQGRATQSSTDYQRDVAVVIDGNTDGRFQNGSVNHTRQQDNPWLEIDLGSEQPIDKIVVWNRLDGQEKRLSGYRLKVLSENREIVFAAASKTAPRPSKKHLIDGSVNLNFVAAYADYEQPGFGATDVINQKLNPRKGWAIGGAVNKQHALTLSLDQALNPNGGTLEIVLKQESIHKKHLLTQFRFSRSADPRALNAAKIPSNIRQLLTKDQRSEKDEQHLVEYYRTIAPELQSVRDELAAIKGKLAKLKPTTTVPIMKERSKPRETKIQIRGNFQDTSEIVYRGTPAAFHPLPDDGQSKNRLALARWLVDPNNPLTARVIVNRFWEQIFGTGIVATNEEFGSQGELPSHPELLDWLATEFQKDWNVKRLLRLMVTSSTYCQTSNVTIAQQDLDPQNRFLSRGPRFRIPAETIRDQTLKVSGLLNPKMHGPPVKPFQPDLGLRAAFGAVTDWKMSSGNDRYRRGVYTSWRRSNPYASMVAFDAPNREVCTSRRGRTNTPLQALVTLNDPVYIEAAQALARRIVLQGGKSTEHRIAFAFRECLTREPTDAEVKELKKMLTKVRTLYSDNAEQAKNMAQNPLGPLPQGMEPVELACWTVLSNVVLNLDEIFLKR